jgi:hypothetical protein
MKKLLKPIKSIFLPTEEITGIVLHSTGLDPYYSNTPSDRKDNLKAVKDIGGISQHVYVTISQEVEPIKEGNVFAMIHPEGLYSTIIMKCKPSTTILPSDRKVISTSDPKLTLKTYGNIFNIPQTPKSFLKDLLSNPKGDFEIEYEWKQGDIFGLDNLDRVRFINDTELENCSGTVFDKSELSDDEVEYVNSDTCALATLKVTLNKNNNVKITSVEKKIYSEEEIENLLIKHQSDYRSHVRKTNDWSMDISGWIKKNL